MNASDLRSEAGLQNRQDIVSRMLNPTRETGTQHNPETPEATEFQETEDHPHSKDYTAEMELQQDMDFAARQAAELRTKEKRESMRQRVYDDLNTKDLALYMAHEEAKRGIRDSLNIEGALQME
eukprot:234399-Heterocapsa_arctica.AAC.1